MKLIKEVKTLLQIFPCIDITQNSCSFIIQLHLNIIMQKIYFCKFWYFTDVCPVCFQIKSIFTFTNMYQTGWSHIVHPAFDINQIITILLNQFLLNKHNDSNVETMNFKKITKICDKIKHCYLPRPNQILKSQKSKLSLIICFSNQKVLIEYVTDK